MILAIITENYQTKFGHRYILGQVNASSNKLKRNKITKVLSQLLDLTTVVVYWY